METLLLIISLLNSGALAYLCYTKYSKEEEYPEILPAVQVPIVPIAPPVKGSSTTTQCVTCKRHVARYNADSICANCEAGNL